MKRALGEVRIDFGDAAVADAVHRALAPDNAEYVTARVEGSVLVAGAAADSPGGLLHTLDDLLACVTAAEKAARAGRDS